MYRSECCGGMVYDDYDICSDCLEHCEVWFDGDEEDEDESKCKQCKTELDGIMIFYPELCLFCVIKKENNA